MWWVVIRAGVYFPYLWTQLVQHIFLKVCTNMHSVLHEICIHGFVALCFVCVLLLWVIYPCPCLAIRCTNRVLKSNTSLNSSVCVCHLCCFNWHDTSFNHMNCIPQSLLGYYGFDHNSDVIMIAIESQITGVSIVYSTICLFRRR